MVVSDAHQQDQPRCIVNVRYEFSCENNLQGSRLLSFLLTSENNSVNKPKYAESSSKAKEKQKFTSDEIPIKWYVCDWHFYNLTILNVFEEQKMSDLIDERYDKIDLTTVEVQ